MRHFGTPRTIGLTLALLLTAPAQAQQTPLPGWMAGCWEETKGNNWTEECWTAPRAGSMLGSGRSVRGDQLRNWEVMQILADRDGKIAFWGAPQAANRTPFAMVSQTEREIVFANPAHDYPQRIRYWREGDVLNAETALADGSKAARWTYRRR